MTAYKEWYEPCLGCGKKLLFTKWSREGHPSCKEGGRIGCGLFCNKCIAPIMEDIESRINLSTIDDLQIPIRKCYRDNSLFKNNGNFILNEMGRRGIEIWR